MTTITQAVQKVLDSRWIPEGYRLVEGVTPTTSVYFKEVGTKFFFLGFWGRSIKPTKHCYFTTSEQRQQYTDNFLANYKRTIERTVERRKQQTAPHTLEVGDILYTSWGYDQTNVNFYQITEIVGSRTVKLREVRQSIDHTECYSDYVMPVKNEFMTGPRGEEMTKRVTNGYVKISSCQSASKWDGKPKYQTALGFGH